MLQFLHESEENHFEGVATGNEPSPQYFGSDPSLKIFAQSPTDVIPRTRQAIGTMITLFFTGRKLIVFDTLSKGSRFNQPYFVDYIFPDSKRENVNFHRRIPRTNFWVYMDNSLCHNESKGHQRSRSIMFHDYQTHSIRQI
jgi:hypothetical protein